LPALALSLAPKSAFGRRWFRRAITAYITVILAVAIFVSIAGAYFFAQFGFRMNWIAVEYLRFPREVLEYIWQTYPVVWVFLGLFLFMAGLYWALKRTFWSGAAPAEPIWSQPILAAVLVALCVLAIRGSLDRRPIRIGIAYTVSNNNVASQLALNDFYTLWAAISSHQSDQSGADQHVYPPAKRAAQVAHEMLYLPGDVDVGIPDNPLWRRVVTGEPMKDYNVVVIVMESMSGKGIGAMGHSPSYTPVFDALCRDGTYFQQMYAVGNRTNHGIVGTLCGYPDISGGSVLVRSKALGHFLTLPGCLKDRGYKTVFLYGGKPAWDNLKGFFTLAGIEEFIGQEGGADESGQSAWGVPDELTFKRAHERFVQLADQKFFGVIVTVSNHEPFLAPPCPLDLLPNDSLENKKINSYRYADWAIGEFFRQARGAEYFKKTIFVMVSDHGRDFMPGRTIDVPGYHIPCVIYAPGIVPQRKISTTASQADIAPTVMSLLGGQFEHCFMGRDLLHVPGDDGFATLCHSDYVAMVHNDLALVIPPQCEPMLYRIHGYDQEPVPADQAAAVIPGLQEKLLSYHFMSRQLYLKVRYCHPDKAAPITPR